MKNIFKILTLSIVAGLINFSCQKVIDLDAERLPSQFVVEGSIDVGAWPFVIFSKSGFLYDEINTETIEESYINGANVEVSDGTKTITLSEICFKNYDFFITTEIIDSLANQIGTDEQGAQLFIRTLSNDQMDSLLQSFGIQEIFLDQLPLICAYAIPSDSTFLGEEGKTYSLRIEKDGNVVTSTTTIPLKFEADSLTFKYDEDHPEFAQVFVNLTFSPNSSLGKYVKFGSRKQDENWFYNFLGGSVYSDATFDGATDLTLPLEARQVEGRPLGTDRLFEKGDTAYLQWRNIDRATYEFLFTLENDGGATPFSSPTKIESNINGGLGLWGGFNTSIYKVYIP